MIANFADRETRRVWDGSGSRKLPPSIQSVARRKLRMLNNATSLEELRIPPGNRLEALKGNFTGLHSIRINSQWRICFRWQDSNAHDVQIIDYH
ncbi:type II toxin-antitoxin system RelE/ParE family toxin [Wenzhouxiangella limi]|uniref:Type II toxin-antitoxin system RelE/ParE family toxin n=1 Tax=Wenzhouxiangella limi TaxID=2707351 RepID=A0A845UXK2_9GAMM|nr:type II toxin-antitoxin system RelE/ParE family toxin [Wenzhouxiangella limi]